MLDPEVDLFHGAMAEQVGRSLWPLLDGDAGPGVPTDFLERHLVKRADWMAIWNRRGAAVAYKLRAEATVTRLSELFRTMADLTSGLDHLIAQQDQRASTIDQTADEAEQLVRRVAGLKHKLVLPENRLAARFFEATRLDEFLENTRTLSRSAADRRLAKAMADNINIVANVERKVEWIEVFVISVYVGHLFHMVVAENEALRHAVEGTIWELGGWYLSAGVLVSTVLGFVTGLLLVKPWKHEVH
jgi:hypothetical protein